MNRQSWPATPIWSLLFLLCLAVAAKAEYPPDTEEHLIDAGSYSLFLRVLRGGEPVVLLEAGGGNDSEMWNHLAHHIRETTGATVVAYDRPGFGRSDLPDLPCDMREESGSLWRALDTLDLDRNVVVVGLSYGGWMVRLHANDHPDQVTGIVFIDPFNVPFIEALGVDYCDQHPMMGKRPFGETPPEELTRAQRALLRMVRDGLGPKTAIMRETKIKKGIPVRLLSSRKPFLPEAHEQEAWWASHQTVVAGIPAAILVEALESSHFITHDQPDLVLEQIADVVEEVRGR